MPSRMTISFEDVGNEEIPSWFCGGFERLERVTRVRSQWHAGVAQQHFRPHAFVGENLLVREADARAGKVVLVRGVGGFVVILFVSAWNRDER